MPDPLSVAWRARPARSLHELGLEPVALGLEREDTRQPVESLEVAAGSVDVDPGGEVEQEVELGVRAVVYACGFGGGDCRKIQLRRSAERRPALDVGRIDHLPVASHVATLGADDEQHEVVVAGVRDPSRRRRPDVEDAAGAELARLVTDLDARRARVDEVELVLLVVVMVEALVSGRHDDRVDAEGLDAERLADLAKAVALAELVERPERVVLWHAATLHRRLTVVKRPFKPRWVEHRHGQSPSLPPLVAIAAAGAAGAALALGGAYAVGSLDGTSTVTVREVTVENTAQPTRFETPASRSRSVRSTGARPRRRADHGHRPAPQSIPSEARGARALGSGFVFDKAGYIITNYHVIHGAGSINVTFSNNKSINAKLVGLDPSTDIAVLKVNMSPSALTPLALGDSTPSRSATPSSPSATRSAFRGR